MPAVADQIWFDSIQSELAARKRLEGEATTECDALLPAILDRAFKGEL